MIRLLTNIRLLICGLCLMMLVSAVTLDVHEINEEVSAEQVEIELEESLIENRELLARSNRERQRGFKFASLARNASGLPLTISQRNFLPLSMRTERTHMNGIGAFLRN